MALGSVCLCVLLPLFASPAAYGGSPKCTIIGSNGPDVLRGQPGPDVICGRGGDDRITGGKGADRILGGAGADRLRGGPGQDTMIGGRGWDRCHDSALSFFFSCERKPRSPVAPTDALPNPTPLEAPDVSPPTPVFFSFAGRWVDSSAEAAEMAFNLEAWDPSGIGSVSIGIEGPEGPWRQIELEGGPDERYTVEQGIAIPASTPAGAYRLASLTISDRKGNTRTLSGLQNGANGPYFEFEVFAGPDLEAPELTDLSLSANEVDTSEGPATITISIGARDELSGVKSATAIVVMPDWVPGPVQIGGGGIETPPSEGTKHDGVWTQPHAMAEGAMPGYYRIHRVYLTDLVGNTRSYSQQKLEELGYPTEFLQSDGGDTTPPEILDFWFEPTSLRSSNGERTIQFYTEVRDDITGFGEWPHFGVSRTEVEIEPAFPWTEFTTTGKVPVLVSGSRMEGVWRQEISIEESAAPGEYQVSYVSATDRAGNEAALNGSELEAAGFPHVFVNQP